MAKFVVDRQIWCRGEGTSNSRLLRDDGMRCCIGFVGQQCGIADEHLIGKSDVRSTLGGIDGDEKWPAWMRASLTKVLTSSVYDAYEANDLEEEEVSDEAREDRLKQIFAANGDEIVFVN